MRFAGEKKDWPLTFWCEEFAIKMIGDMGDVIPCCSSCHEESDGSKLIVVFPRSGNGSSLPDCGLGISALICCNLYDTVRSLPRSWWLGHYGEKHGWSEEDIKTLQDASETERWLQVQGKLGSKYFQLRNPGGHSSGTKVRRPDASVCPKCSIKWNGYLCSNCGHSTL